MARQHTSRVAVVVGVLVGALLLAGCPSRLDDSTDRNDSGAAQRGAPGEPSITGAAFDVTLASVAGRIPKRQRAQIRKRAAATVGGYVQEAFLGDYPRTRYRAFGDFTDAARARARRDRGLLTHADRGARYVGVTARRAQVRVHAFAPRRRVLGATARVRLVLRVERDDETVQRVRVTGRLLLTRARNGAFRIFGYDLRRESARPRTGGGA